MVLKCLIATTPLIRNYAALTRDKCGSFFPSIVGVIRNRVVAWLGPITSDVFRRYRVLLRASRSACDDALWVGDGHCWAIGSRLPIGALGRLSGGTTLGTTAARPAPCHVRACTVTWLARHSLTVAWHIS
jgi:hypothetical protein